MLKLIVFDCDGVMFDSREANRVYYNDLLEAFRLPPMNEQEVGYVHMHNVRDSVSYIFRNAPEINLKSVHQFRTGLDYSFYFRHMIMEPGLLDFLEFAKDRYHLAISTNRTTTMLPLLKAFRLDSYFGKVVTADDVANPKPAADALLEILEHYCCKPLETIYIGDSILDRQHTEAAGVPLIAFKNRKLDAEYKVESFAEIPLLPPFTEIED